MLPEAWLAQGMEASIKNAPKGGMKYSRVKTRRIVVREDSVRLGIVLSFQDRLATGRASSFQESIFKTVTQQSQTESLRRGVTAHGTLKQSFQLHVACILTIEHHLFWVTPFPVRIHLLMPGE